MMAKRTTEETTRPRERAFAVGIEIYGSDNLLSLDDSLAELGLLAETAGLDLVGQTTQKIDRPNPQTFIGSGKVEEVRAFIEEFRLTFYYLMTNYRPGICESSNKSWGTRSGFWIGLR
jgi:GTP-binding protein HflX